LRQHALILHRASSATFTEPIIAGCTATTLASHDDLQLVFSPSPDLLIELLKIKKWNQRLLRLIIKSLQRLVTLQDAKFEVIKSLLATFILQHASERSTDAVLDDKTFKDLPVGYPLTAQAIMYNLIVQEGLYCGITIIQKLQQILCYPVNEAFWSYFIALLIFCLASQCLNTLTMLFNFVRNYSLLLRRTVCILGTWVVLFLLRNSVMLVWLRAMLASLVKFSLVSTLLRNI